MTKKSDPEWYDDGYWHLRKWSLMSLIQSIKCFFGFHLEGVLWTPPEPYDDVPWPMCPHCGKLFAEGT